jgi:hypothetical protein
VQTRIILDIESAVYGVSSVSLAGLNGFATQIVHSHASIMKAAAWARAIDDGTRINSAVCTYFHFAFAICEGHGRAMTNSRALARFMRS